MVTFGTCKEVFALTYIEYLQINKAEIQNKLDELLIKFKVQPVGWGYIDCIILKDLLNDFITEISSLGIIIQFVSWWCYVNPRNKDSGCPHGMGGPISLYYDGWFSELQNDMLSLNEIDIQVILDNFERDFIIELNKRISDRIINTLEIPFKYTPHDYIQGNKCVTPALWLFVPDDWRNCEHNLK